MGTMRGLLVLVAIATVAHANPLGRKWRTRYPAKECSAGIDAGPELAGFGDNALVFVDRATGKSRTLALPKLDGKTPEGWFVSDVIGDTAIVGTASGTIGVDTRTGALRWRRAARVERIERRVRASGSTHAVEVEASGGGSSGSPVALVVERFDATTGTSAWKATVPTKRTRFIEVLTSDKHVYVISDDITPPSAFTIVAYDLAGKKVWSVDDVLSYGPSLDTIGDDLVAIDRVESVTVFAGATGKKAAWKVDWNSHPIVAGDALYSTPDDYTVVAYNVDGTKRWTTKLPSPHPPRFTMVKGTASGVVYLTDGDFIRTLDAKAGTLLGSTGIPDLDHAALHTGTPAITACTGGSGRTLVAFDGSTPAPEHRVTIRGRIRCKNCTAETQIEVWIGDAAMTLGADRRFSLDLTARGSLPLEVRDATFPASTRIRLVDFTVDRTLTLGDVAVTLPERGFD